MINANQNQTNNLLYLKKLNKLRNDQKLNIFENDVIDKTSIFEHSNKLYALDKSTTHNIITDLSRDKIVTYPSNATVIRTPTEISKNVLPEMKTPLPKKRRKSKPRIDERFKTEDYTHNRHHLFWSPWQKWTQCSRSCGGGTTMQFRNCLSK